MARPTVAIILGSDSDWPTMEPAYQELRSFGVPVEVEVISSHRAPDRLRDYVRSADDRNIGIFIAAAGMAAALPGAVAALTTLPVIGVPLAGGELLGLDSLLSIVQMPPGVPVATMAVGQAGARNGALFAVQILALGDPDLRLAMENHKRNLAQSVDNKSQALRERLRRA